MPQNPQNAISQTEPKHYNQLIVVKTEAIIWLQITTDIGKKIKVETAVKERDTKLLDFITIDILKIEQKHYSDQEIINLSMTPIINSSFNKHPLSW